MGGIWLLSEQPHSGALTEKFLGPWNIAVRKLAHMSEYGILFWLLRRALIQTARADRGEISSPVRSQDQCSPVLLDDEAIPQAAARQCASGGIGSGPVALLLSILYAISDEWHQSYVPGRSATIQDTLVDTAGACLGWAAVRLADIIQTRTASAEKP
jgi:hypothetical protein